jgi:hypothetical protein
MNSPGHRENLLSADYTQVGLGLALGTPTDQTWGATYTTDFGAGATPAPTHPRAKAAAASRRKASRAASCARAASARRSSRSTTPRRSPACSRPARARRR